MPMKKHFKKSIAALFIALMVLPFFTGTTLAAAAPPVKDIERELKNQEAQLKKIERQIAENRKRQQNVKQQETKVMGDLRKLVEQMTVKQVQHNVTVARRDKVVGKMNEISANIMSTNARIKTTKKLLQERLVAIYKYGNVAEFNLLMSASGAQDALQTSYLLGKIADTDKLLIQKLMADKLSLDQALADLNHQKKELEKKNEQLNKEKSMLQAATTERNRILNKVRKDKATFEAEQDELMKASRELQNKIKTLITQKRKSQQNTPVYFTGGRLAWPLRGKINSPYGTRIHPVFKTKTTHTGIDIDGDKGDPVRAAATGEVLYTGWLRGYGMVVILDHGGNLTTVYAHLSAISTQEGTKANMGDVIGRVGSTGVATGNHLHFEVRVNGNTVNPMSYLK